MGWLVILDMSLCCDVELGDLIGGDDSVGADGVETRLRWQEIGEKRAVHAMRKWLSGLRAAGKRGNGRRRVTEEEGRTLNYKAEQFGHTSIQAMHIRSRSGEGWRNCTARSLSRVVLYDPPQALQHRTAPPSPAQPKGSSK